MQVCVDIFLEHFCIPKSIEQKCRNLFADEYIQNISIQAEKRIESIMNRTSQNRLGNQFLSAKMIDSRRIESKSSIANSSTVWSIKS